MLMLVLVIVFSLKFTDCNNSSPMGTLYMLSPPPPFPYFTLLKCKTINLMFTPLNY